jgi:hypothetical protein
MIVPLFTSKYSPAAFCRAVHIRLEKHMLFKENAVRIPSLKLRRLKRTLPARRLYKLKSFNCYK